MPPPSSVPPIVAPVIAPPAAFSHILERIQRGEILLPSVPSKIQELRALVVDRDVPIKKIAKLVERDQALAARVLHLGRGARSGTGAKPGVDLEATIAHIGFQTIHALLETIWLNGCFQSKDPRFIPFSQQLARFGLARAVASRCFAVPANLDASLAYFGGLFADVGAAFLLYVIVEKAASEVPDPNSAMAFVQEHHEAIGAQLLTHWVHADEVIQRARHHHTATGSLPRDPYARLCLLATATARELTGEEDLTGPTPAVDDADRCARELRIVPRVRKVGVEVAATELGAMNEVM